MSDVPLRLKSTEDNDDGSGWTSGNTVIWCGDVDNRMSAFLWANLMYHNKKTTDAKEGKRLVVNSGGGCINEMCAIVDLMEEADLLTTVATGSCMSAAVPIVAAGTPGLRFATHRCRFMIHPPSIHIGDSSIQDLDLERGEFSWAVEAYADIMARYCYHTRRWWRDRLSKGPWYFGSQVAVEHGIIDTVLTDPLAPKKRKKR